MPPENPAKRSSYPPPPLETLLDGTEILQDVELARHDLDGIGIPLVHLQLSEDFPWRQGATGPQGIY